MSGRERHVALASAVLPPELTLLAYSVTRRVACGVAADLWFMIFCAVAFPRPAAEWCGHVDAAAALAGCS